MCSAYQRPVFHAECDGGRRNRFGAGYDSGRLFFSNVCIDTDSHVRDFVRFDGVALQFNP